MNADPDAPILLSPGQTVQLRLRRGDRVQVEHGRVQASCHPCWLDGLPLHAPACWLGGAGPRHGPAALQDGWWRVAAGAGQGARLRVVPTDSVGPGPWPARVAAGWALWFGRRLARGAGRGVGG